MRWRSIRLLFIVSILATWAGATSQPAQSQSENGQATLPSQANLSISNAISYQGFLQHDGKGVEGVCDLHFSLFDAPTNGAQQGNTLERANQSVQDGYFTVNDLDFGPLFVGQALWIEVAVRCPAGSDKFTTLTPRQPLLATPYALFALKAATATTATDAVNATNATNAANATNAINATNATNATNAINALNAANNWALLGNGETNPATNFVGTTDAASLTLRVSNTVALRLLPNATSPSVLGGIAGNTVTPGVLGATIAGGGGPDSGVPLTNKVTDNYGAISGGAGNQAGDNSGTTANHPFATVGGGRTNAAKGSFATVGGGQANTAQSDHTTIGGGVENVTSGQGATIGGGQTNGATGENSTIGGGIDNATLKANGTVGGGTGNNANGQNATVAGGSENSADGDNSAIGGGSSNFATAHATVAGGSSNQASGSAATVSGGDQNEASAKASTIGGGSTNQASGSAATISGGIDNQATGKNTTVAGGSANQASGEFATVSGGTKANATHFGEWAYATGSFDGPSGEAQSSLYLLRAETNGNSATLMGLNDAFDQLTIAPGRTVAFDIQIAARSTGGESAGFTARGVIENQAGTTSIVGVLAFSLLGKDDASWTANVSADNSTDSLEIQVSGATGDTIRWVATVRTTEVQN